MIFISRVDKMVSGQYGKGLVDTLYTFSIASGYDPQLVFPTPLVELSKVEILKNVGNHQIRTLPLEYTGDLNLDVSLISSKNSVDRLVVLDSDLRPNLERILGGEKKGPQEDEPDLSETSYLLISGKQASEAYERLRKRIPQTISHLRAILRP